MELIDLTKPFPISNHPNRHHVYFYNEKIQTAIDDKTLEPWFKQIKPFLPYTKGLGLDIGSGGRTLRPDVFRIDKDEAVAPHLVWDGTTLPMFLDNSVDFIFSNQSIEHIEDTLKALQEWTRVTREDGYICILTIDRAAYGPPGAPNTDPDHKHCWYKDEFWKMIQNWIASKKLQACIVEYVDLGADYGIVLQKI